MYLKYGLAVAFALVAGAASAATYNFDYTGSQTNASGPTLSCDALGILNYAGCSVTYNAAGLGVNGKPDLPSQVGSIDGFPLFSSERLTFTFATDMIWNSITLGGWDANDDLRLTYDGNTATYGPGGDSTFNLGGVTSKFLTVTAYGQLGQDGSFRCLLGCSDPDRYYDIFTVASINVSDVAAVPLPAAGLLLIGAIGGLAAFRRRKA
jgi:hypothetical protein